MLRARGSTDATVGSGKVRNPGGGRGNGNGKGPNGGGGGPVGSVWSPTDKYSTITISSSVMTLPNTSINVFGKGTQSWATGDHYFEVTLTGASSIKRLVGLATSAVDATSTHALGGWIGGNDYGYNSGTGQIRLNNIVQGTVATSDTGDVIGIRYTADNGSSQGIIRLYKNGTLLHTFTNAVAFNKAYFPAGGQNSSGDGTVGISNTINTGAPLYLPSGSTAWG